MMKFITKKGGLFSCAWPPPTAPMAPLFIATGIVPVELYKKTVVVAHSELPGPSALARAVVPIAA